MISNLLLGSFGILHKKRTKNILKMNKDVGMLLQKRVNTSGVGISNFFFIFIFLFFLFFYFYFFIFFLMKFAKWQVKPTSTKC